MRYVLLVAVLGALIVAPVRGVSAQEVRPLVQGWNLVGASQQSVTAFVAERNGASDCTVRAIWRFNGDQTWSAWFSNAPELDEIGSLSGSSGYWVYCG